MWFLFLGLLWLLAGFRPPPLGVRDIFMGLVIFAILWIAVGVMGQFVWLQWLLIPARLVRWPLVAAAFLPALMAAALAQCGKPAWKRVLWWIGLSLALTAGLVLTIVLVPSLFFTAIVLPLVPFVLAIMGITSAAFDRPWAVGLGNALFFGWLIVAVFPLLA
jgi:hypothetical protein